MPSVGLQELPVIAGPARGDPVGDVASRFSQSGVPRAIQKMGARPRMRDMLLRIQIAEHRRWQGSR